MLLFKLSNFTLQGSNLMEMKNCAQRGSLQQYLKWPKEEKKKEGHACTPSEYACGQTRGLLEEPGCRGSWWGAGGGLAPGGQGDNSYSDGKRWERVNVGACGIIVIDDVYPTHHLLHCFKQPYEMGTSVVLVEKKEKQRGVK